MAGRFIIYTLSALAGGLVLAALAQVGFNYYRFEMQPAWLSGASAAWGILLAGLSAAVLLAAPIALAAKRALGVPGALWLLAGLVCGLMLDPYFLAQLGWNDPARAQPVMRVLALAIAALGLSVPVARTGTSPVLFALMCAIALFAFGFMDRFALVPVLGGLSEVAAMSPIYLLVYVKGVLLLLGGAALALRWGRPRALR